MGRKNHVQILYMERHFLGRGMCLPMVTYLPQANVSAQRTRGTTAFATSWRCGLLSKYFGHLFISH